MKESQCQTSSTVHKIDRQVPLKQEYQISPHIALVMVNIACNVPFHPADATIPRSDNWQPISASNCFRWRRVHLRTDNDPSGQLGSRSRAGRKT